MGERALLASLGLFLVAAPGVSGSPCDIPLRFSRASLGLAGPVQTLTWEVSGPASFDGRNPDSSTSYSFDSEGFVVDASGSRGSDVPWSPPRPSNRLVPYRHQVQVETRGPGSWVIRPVIKPTEGFPPLPAGPPPEGLAGGGLDLAEVPQGATLIFAGPPRPPQEGRAEVFYDAGENAVVVTRFDGAGVVDSLEAILDPSCRPFLLHWRDHHGDTKTMEWFSYDAAGRTTAHLVVAPRGCRSPEACWQARSWTYDEAGVPTSLHTLENPGNLAHAYGFQIDELRLDQHGNWVQRRVHWCRRETDAGEERCRGPVWERRALVYDP